MAQSYSLARLASSTVATKAAMAVSGLGLFGFLIGHMLGNLQVFGLFGGREAMNAYGHFLHSHPMFLWSARLGLLGLLMIHFVSAWRLIFLNNAARPVPYKVKKPIKSTYASRTMRYTGPIVMVYIIYHLLHFTIAGVGIAGYPFKDSLGQVDVYKHVVISFQMVPVALAYIVANALLGLHLWHGLWALFQSLGLVNPKFDALKRTGATALTIFVIAGLLAVPFGVLFGVVAL